MAQWLSYPTFSGPFSGQEQLLAASSTSPGAGMIRIPWSVVSGAVTGSFLPLSGGALSGPLTLAADPTTPLQAATKEYVDGFLPRTGGTMTGPITLSGNATLPLQAVPLQQLSSIVGGPYLQIAGGTLTGPLILAADPVTALGAATKQYADNNFLFLSGGTLSGPLVLAADPLVALGAATKEYVDNASFLPLGGGTVTGPIVLPGNATLPLQAVPLQQVNSIVGGPYLPIAGGTLTGALILAADPTASLGAATKHYVDVNIGTGPFLPLAGGTVTGATTFSAAGTALTVTNNATVGGTATLGNGGVANISVAGGATNALINATKGVQLSLNGGTGTSFFVNVPGLGNPFVVTAEASSGAHIVDTTASVLKTKYHFINPGALALSGAYSTTTSPLAMSMSFSGTPGTTSGGYPVMQWAVTADTAIAAASSFLRLIDIEHNWGGAAMTGGRQTINIHLNQQASSGNTTQNAYYQGLNIASDVAFNEGGSGVTSGTAQGHNVPFGVYARMETGATNFFANNACEWNVLAQTGTSMLRQFGNSIVKISGHAVQGSIDDAALSIADQTGVTAGWKTVFGIGSNLGQDPLGSTSAIMQWIAANNPATKAPQAATGIDISLGPISGNAFASRDFRVASGAVYPFQGAITQNSVGIAIDVPNYIIGYSSINNGTTTLGRVGDWYGDSVTGLIVSITTLSGPTLVTGATIQRVGYAASNPGPVTVSNLNVDTGGSFIVNITATLNNTLALQPSGGSTTFGGPVTLPPSTTGPFLLLTGGTVSGPTTFSSSGTALTVTNNATVSGTLAAGGTTTLGNASTNFIQVVGAATNPTVQVAGGGTNGALILQTQGHGSINLRTATGGIITQLVDGSGGTIGNNLTITAKAAGSAVTLVASDATAGLLISGTPVQLSRAITYSGVAATVANIGLTGSWTYTGTSTDSSTASVNGFSITDNVVNTHGGLGTTLSWLGITTRLGAASAGPRNSAQISISQTASTANFADGTYAAWTALQTNASAGFSEGGTAGLANINGAIFGQTTGMTLNSGATNFAGCVGHEYDVIVAAGASVGRNVGIQFFQFPSHRVQGTYLDSAIHIAGSVGSAGVPGWKSGIDFGSGLDTPGFDTNSTFIYAEIPRTFSVYTVGWGIDLLQPTFSSGFMRSQGFSVDPSGTVQVGTGLVKALSTGLSVDVTGAVGTGTPTVAAGGSGWAANNIMYDAYGGVYLVAGESGGVLLTVTVLIQPAVPGTPPSNPVPVTVTACDGTGATLNLTWSTSRTVLSLQPSGGVVKLGSGCFTANASTAVTLTALAPAGAHSTVQEWLTITDSAGTVRYIPCF